MYRVINVDGKWYAKEVFDLYGELANITELIDEHKTIILNENLYAIAEMLNVWPGDIIITEDGE